MNQDQQRQFLELQQQLGERGGQRQQEEEASGAAASGGSIKLRWRDGGRAPFEMYGEMSAVDGSVAYFTPGTLVQKLYLPTIPLITNGLNFPSVLTMVSV